MTTIRCNIYRYAEENGFTKITSMPSKLLTDNKRNTLIRPLAYCQESDIKIYPEEQQSSIIHCNLCGSQENLARQQVKK